MITGASEVAPEEAYSRIIVNGIVVCSVLSTSTGVGNTVKIKKGTTFSYTLKSNNIQTANIYKTDCQW